MIVTTDVMIVTHRIAGSRERAYRSVRPRVTRSPMYASAAARVIAATQERLGDQELDPGEDQGHDEKPGRHGLELLRCGREPLTDPTSVCVAQSWMNVTGMSARAAIPVSASQSRR